MTIFTARSIPPEEPVEILPSPLGALATLPPELRKEVYSNLIGADYKQTYLFDADGSIRLDGQNSQPTPSFLRVSRTLRNEICDELMLDRECEVRVEEKKLITNFPLHDLAKLNSASTSDLRGRLKIPTCKQINVIVSTPSPRDGWRFYQCRKTVQELISLINSRDLNINPQIRAGLDRTGTQYTRSYNDFAMFIGPFGALDKRCKAVMVYRTTGFSTFIPGVSTYCNLIEAAMKGVPEAKLELTLHQLQLDLKLPIAFHFNAKCFVEELTERDKLTQAKPTEQISRKVSALYDFFGKSDLPLPPWLGELDRHIRHECDLKHIIEVLNMGDRSASDSVLWAAGLLSGYNPLFDDSALLAPSPWLE